MKRQSKWTSEELERLRSGATSLELSQELGRTVKSVEKRREQLSREQSPEERAATTAVRLRDELQSAKAKLTSLHRERGLFEELAALTRELSAPMRPAPMVKRPSVIGKGLVEESLVMHLSDEHADQIVVPSRVGGLEEYNFRVAMARAERYVDVVKRHAFENLANYRFKDLWVLAYGDHVNGEIHDSRMHSEWRNQLKSTLAVGQMHAQMLAELAPLFERVFVVYLSGNHGRRTVRKEYDAPQNNWDWMVGQVAAAHLAAHKNVQIIAPDSFDAVLEIEGWRFHVQHGDDIKSWNSIPWYGIERATRRLSALEAVKKDAVHYFCLGHFHGHGTQQHTTGEILLNGAWLATTPYVYNGLKGYNRPMQLLHGVHKEHGVSWRMPVYLKHAGDVDGPKRYKVSFAE